MERTRLQLPRAVRLVTEDVYWAIPVLLALVQLAFTQHSRAQLRYEELAESVRNVYWLEHRTIYDGVSSNVGWYGTLLVTYKTFGFSLHAAKYVRFGLSCVSLLTLAFVLRRFFPARQAWLPLLVIGLSPTLLYFNTLQAQYGVDLQYVPIVLYLVLSIDFSGTSRDGCKQLLLGSFAMIACMSYPTFVFYLPSLAVLYVYRVRQCGAHSARCAVPRSVVLAAAGFALPLLATMMYVKDAQLLLFDTATKSGIFRGAGSVSWKSLNPSHLALSMRDTVRDMFYRAGSYYFEVVTVDFSNYYPLAAVGFALATSVVLIVFRPKTRLAFVSAWILLLTTAIGAHLTTAGTSGMRRSTAMLAAVYALFAVGWYEACRSDRQHNPLKLAMSVSLVLVLSHHVAAIPANYRALATESPYQFNASPFFSSAGTPSESLRAYVQQAQSADLELRCPHESAECRYAEIYAAIAGSCLWNRLSCHTLYAYDQRSGQSIPLSIHLWESHYWKH